MDRVPDGQKLGWIFDPDNPDHDGDNYVDFGLCDGYADVALGLVDRNSLMKTIMLNFNCDGIIWDKI